MASYLSYFTSGPSNNPSQSYSGQSASSTWSSTFSSRIATLRKALTKDAEEDDPDNEDCSHVSNVLRAYYTEKGRTFPEWLPSDPKRPAPVHQQSQYGQYGQPGNAYGSQYSAQPGHGRGGSGGRAGLSDLWDSSPAAPAAAPAPQSLRAPRPTPQSLRTNESGTSQPSSGGLTSTYPQPGPGARPLPSQRAGSFQNTQGASSPAMGSRDRLRARLQGGSSGRSSPAPASGQVSYSSAAGSHDYSGGGGSPYVSASEPWSNTGNPYQPDTSSPVTNPYGDAGYKQPPGGPR